MILNSQNDKYNTEPDFFKMRYRAERFKSHNIALASKRLSNQDAGVSVSINLLDIENHEPSLTAAYAAMIELGNVVYLVLDADQIKPDICKIPSIKGLYISGKSRDTLPDYLADLPNLLCLYTPDIRLDRIPECVFKMPLLKAICLKVKSAMKQLPEFIDTLPSDIEHLAIYNSGITSLPENIGRLQKLKSLNLVDNKLVKLPHSMTQLTALESIKFTIDTKVDADKHYYYVPSQLAYASPEEPIEFVKSILPNIECLSISINSLTENTIHSFSKLHSLSVSGILDMKYNILQALGKIPNLKDLQLNFEIEQEDLEDLHNLSHIEKIKFHNIRYKNINALSELPKVKSISLEAIGQESSVVLDKNWQNLSCLEELHIKAVTIDWKFVQYLPALKKIYVSHSPLNFDTFLKKNPQIEALHCHEKTEALPSILTLKKLKNLSIGLYAFDNTLPKHISQLESLEHYSLHLYGCQNLDYLKEFLEELITIKTLKIIQIWERDMANTEGWEVLNERKDVKVVFANRVHQPEPAIASLLHVDFKEASPISEKYNQLNSYVFQNIQQRIIAFCLICENTEGVKKYLPNTLKQKMKPNDCFFILGRPHGMTKPQMKEQLLSKGFQVSEKLNDLVQHIIIGQGVGVDEAYKIVTSNKTLYLSEYITDMLNSPDDFFLLHDDHKDLEQQIIPLFLSEEETNHLLALELMKGGGAPKRILNYLFVMQGIHPNLEIRKDARKLFKRFATQDLVKFAQGFGWDYLKGQPESGDFRHEELSYWDCVLAYQQHRNRITIDRLQRTWTFSRDQPNTIYLNEHNIDMIAQIPEEIGLTNANGIMVRYLFSNYDAVISRIMDIPKLIPQLKTHFYCQSGDITFKQYKQLEKAFDNVHLNTYFKVKD